MKQKPQTVFVGLSGGVDSSVAALRLLRAGYNVVGVFIKVWHPDWLVCNWEQERLDAMRVAAKLKIPFLTCDAEDAYKNDVADYFISEYIAGRTPNPDVMCNKHVKFGRFLEFANEHGADFVATGHYAQNIKTDSHFMLHRGIDTGKDQSYFLWTLTQTQLAHVLLPVGDSIKATIRQEAAKAGLLTAEKKDSQGICFLGHIDIPEFLRHYTTLTPGKVINEHGEVIGEHQGALVYTTGQRHGFTIRTHSQTETPHYVIARDLEANTITVSPTKPELSTTTSLKLREVNIIGEPLDLLDTFSIQTRYRQRPQEASLTHITPDSLTLSVSKTAEAVSVGQSCVLYQGNLCLGGGIIDEHVSTST